MRIIVLILVALALFSSCTGWAEPVPTPTRAVPTPQKQAQSVVATATPRSTSTPRPPRTPTVSIPTREPTPNIGQMLEEQMDANFARVKRRDAESQYVCKKKVSGWVAYGMCFGRGTAPPDIKKITLWQWDYYAGDSENTMTVMKVFLYTATDPFGVLQVCANGGCDQEILLKADGIRDIEQEAASWEAVH